MPKAHRGTYLAFADAGNGTKHLRALAEAGLNTVHLLPTFDITSVPERRSQQQTPDCDLAALPPASDQQQACVTAVAAQDGYNWGYDPYHWMAPEGSYATNPTGAARVAQFRTMVGALHRDGLRVVLDQVYNHTSSSGQAATSVLDRVVPGYYQRLNPKTGAVETSTCCQNVATEHAMAERAMVDSVVLWAKQYRVDGFRFDLMGHRLKANLLAVRHALDRLTLRRDGVDGTAIYLYGEGWNFGEVADDALFEQARQGNLGGTGIGTFSDRLRDAVRGGGPFDDDPRAQGLGSGLAGSPNGAEINGDAAKQAATLAHDTDLVEPRHGRQPARLRVPHQRERRGGAWRRGRLQRPAGRVRRRARRGGVVRRRPRQRDDLGRAHPEACRRRRRWPTASG
ncbi:hypothetical protein GCM10025868_33270 [Angustibacter aerolatus]|uniref:Glycosyl hydrolase family 13 catalytic domain-containing protein n=1 Tax=Angustibacter aerolatus TaxID=1162965 RepID=A0ABQ6JIK8_9ACTN|nr:hypothetical protein GCM10025868_33270 [Angustibacter aerolatus]